ncbi:ras guanine nucleotide exchange factor Q-like, partial [Aphis craccivora]
NSTKNKFYSGTKERRKYKPRIKKCNTVITKVENQMPLELKNDDNKISENSINYMKHKKPHQIPINSDSCVSHKSMTLDDNMDLDTSS